MSAAAAEDVFGIFRLVADAGFPALALALAAYVQVRRASRPCACAPQPKPPKLPKATVLRR